MINCSEEIYDLIGIGFGPAGIALGVAIDDHNEGLSEEKSIKALFLEKANDSTWQGNMLLPRAHIQHHFFRDLVTPYNPRSKYTFANYLKEKGRLFQFGLLGLTPGRIEWNDYISWVAQQLNQYVIYQQNVIEINPIKDAEGNIDLVEVITTDVVSNEIKKFKAKNITVNTGRTPYIPEQYKPLMGEKVFHPHFFKKKIENFKAEDKPNFAVIGSGQNAIEVILNISNKFPEADVYSINRNLGFKTYDLGQFSNEVYHPEFVDYFYGLTKEERQKLFDEQMKATNYSAVGPHVSTDLYWKVYEQSIEGINKIHVMRCQEVLDVKDVENGYELHLKDNYTKEELSINVDGIVVCTGFTEEKIPRPLDSILNYLELHEDGDIDISRNYEIATTNQFNVGVYANGITERTHGISDATSFSMMALKAKHIFDHVQESKKANQELLRV